MKALLTFGLASLAVTIILFSSCKSSNEKNRTTKTNKATENLIDAKKDFDEAKSDYIEKYEAFKVDANARITENEKTIAILKTGIKNKSKAVKADLEKK